MSGGIGISSYGVFIPRCRIARSAIVDAHAWALPGLKALGRGERAFGNWDEDAITMGVQAARNCLEGRAGMPADVSLASTTAPFADLQNSSILCQALRMSEIVKAQDFSGSTRAGLRALAQALDAAGAATMVVGADCRRARPGSSQELTYGAGAAAFLTGYGDVLARYLGGHSVSAPFVDHFRQSGEKYDYFWEERWIRDAGVVPLVPAVVTQLLNRIEIRASRVAWFGVAGVPAGSDSMVAKVLGIAPERLIPNLQGTVGDTGAAHALLLLASAIERGKPGDIVVIAAFGLGCEALAFEIADGGARPASGLEDAVARKNLESSYLKMLSFAGELNLDWGPRSETTIKASLSQQYRSASQVLGFIGGQCTACGQVQFPALPTCVNCAASGAMTPYPLSDAPARIVTASADWLQFYPAPPLYVGLVQFDAGARALMEIVDVPLAGIEVGTPVRFAFRVKACDELRHYSRYFWKAVPDI